MTRIINSLSVISANYDALFVDLWGCVHNGVEAIPSAVTALQEYRKSGGIVILVTNSPRPRAGVVKQLIHFKVPEDAYDAIATSGDSARSAMYRGVVGNKVWHYGPVTDSRFFDPLDILENPQEITRVPLEEATGIVCTGPFDAQADPETWRPELEQALSRGLKLLCANPDIVVDRGEVREWCAGAVAKMYTEMGGESLYFGKPHAPIYDLARRRLYKLASSIPDQNILAIGDGILTDVKGGIDEGIDSLFISGGLAAAETKTTTQPDEAALRDYLEKEKLNPSFTIGHLR
ncbi:TIGR01459 family HAD-type hydrolase [Sulfitobacter donghicola]|uniref:HAD family hydrolase n=1 Tax=Sulfitobacter donghicola DSW-25 = KCTC 12864 = JCM 14565 TaxID=1300350 RepID=A0A073IG93_9RHOB|nr:TIGR01459 family HAD-type hydrolase [Sulfitobacter donghicola]KEJ88824.1 HAD family hydrolase [Sulfitobacter donghicola DSW-25 = KCTC 12864 = JCM 14565]KIN68619.1 HAD-superfamily subfamily IIA hydrolase [Sulfitobacter donghicola DSW-25 = KCTC 12864 = JCM 14565]